MEKRKLIGILALVLIAVMLVACAAPSAPAAPAPAESAPAESAAAPAPAESKEAPAPAESAAAPAADDAEQGEAAADPKKMTVISSTKGMDNEYYVELNRGGQEFADQLGMEYVTLSSEDNEQKQVSDLETALVTYEPDFVIIMPTSATTTPALADLCEAAKVPFITLWDYPDGFDFNKYEYHLAHLLTDTFNEGYTIGSYLFDAMGGEGSIVAIDGLAGNTTANNRHLGLEKALQENPGITLLESQPGDWNRFATAPVFEDMYIKYGDEIDGVWCANDDMALGVVEILSGVDKLGKVKLVGLDCLSDALKQIQAGNYLMSMSGDAPGMQALAMCIGYDYVMGNIKPETDENKFIMYAPPIITSENVDEYYDLWYGPGAASRDWTLDSKVLQGNS